jgi:hypothetical protein
MGRFFVKKFGKKSTKFFLTILKRKKRNKSKTEVQKNIIKEIKVFYFLDRLKNPPFLDLLDCEEAGGGEG